MTSTVRVGLIGAGPWAHNVHAPGLADHPQVTLSAVWARRAEATTELAAAHEAQVFTDFAELLDAVDAVAFAVPPAVQAELAVQAARAGKHLILEKPIAQDTASAELLVEEIDKAGVAALVMFTLRYAQSTQTWLSELEKAGGWTGGNAQWLSGALLGETYGGSAWRHSSGALADIGPHAVDLLDAALGPINRVLGATRTSEDLWHLLLQHESGAASTASLSLKLPIDPSIVELSVYGQHGIRTLRREPGVAKASYLALLDDLVAMINTGVTEHRSDARRGLHIQRILDAARALAQS